MKIINYFTSFFSGSSPGQSEGRNTLVVNVTRTPTAATDLAPFKVVTRTNIPNFQRQCYEVYRSAGDFHWLHDVLQDNCPERIVPPLRSTISLDGKYNCYSVCSNNWLMNVWVWMCVCTSCELC